MGVVYDALDQTTTQPRHPARPWMKRTGMVFTRTLVNAGTTTVMHTGTLKNSVKAHVHAPLRIQWQ